MSRGTLGLVGAGAVGPAIARLLATSGWRVGTIASRSPGSARKAARFVGSGTVGARNSDAADGADLLLVAVPDRAIAEVAAGIARSGKLRRGALALHFSGALSSGALAPLARIGASTGSLHPLQSFVSAAGAVDRLATTWLFYEGDDPERIRAVADDISPRSAPLAREAKTLYHAGAAAACNLFVAMVDVGVRLMETAGIPPEDALAALLPLVRGTTENLAEAGLPDALTGPVARGDVDTVRAHIDAIRTAAPDLLAAYREASRHAVGMGLAKGSLSPKAADEIRDLLAGPTPSRG